MKRQQLPATPIVFLVNLLFASAHLLAAEDQSPVPAMEALVTQEQYQQAFALGQENLNEWEGDPDFDYIFGLAALESGDANDSFFALERVAATATDSGLRALARLELARAYFVTNNLTAPENLFNAVLATNPPPNVQQNIQFFLQLSAARQNAQTPTLNWTVSPVIGSDSNANSATSNGLIDTPLIGQIELDPAGQETEDNFSNTTLTMAYQYPFTDRKSVV